MVFFSNLTDRYKSLLKNNEAPLQQARIRILTFGLLLLILLAVFVLGILAIHPHPVIVIRVVVFIGALIYAAYLLIYKEKWKSSAHIFLISLCIFIWTNIVLYKHGVNVVMIQLSLIVISSSFYILGKNWGLIYAVCNVSPVIIYLLFTRLQDGKVYLTDSQINNNTFMLTMIANFILIIVMHNEFFKSFYLSQAKERELNEQLQSALNEANEATRMRSDFLSSMSHELRTPLHAVIGMTNLLSVENPRKDQEESLAVLRFSTENLLALINDTLDFSKMNENKISLNKAAFNLNLLLHNIYSSFRAKVQQKGLNMMLNIDLDNDLPYVIGDQTRLIQILNNLVSNAIKFTDANGLIQINIKTISRTKEQISLSFAVIDNGIGIPESKQDIIFEPFLQANNNITKRYGGTGLGLAIVKRLIALHGSELKLKSEVNKGSNFSFDLTYELTAEEYQPTDLLTTAKNVVDISNLHVLIAEDNMINVMVLKKILDQWSCTYAVAGNGIEALEMAKTGVFDVILMDIHMPMMDGFEASKQIRALANVEIANIKIIALTASSEVDIQQSFSYTYLDDYLTKPFSPDSLKKKLDSLVQQSTRRI